MTVSKLSVKVTTITMVVCFTVRPANVADMPDLNGLQRVCYPPFFYEEPEVFEKMVKHRMSVVAELVDERTASRKKLVGYGLVHGIDNPLIPPCLNTAEEAGPCDSGNQHHDEEQGAVNRLAYCNHVFIHDVSVHVSVANLAIMMEGGTWLPLARTGLHMATA